MTASDFYKKHKECVSTGEAVKEPGSDRLFCSVHGGLCALKKCLSIHKNIDKRKSS